MSADPDPAQHQKMEPMDTLGFEHLGIQKPKPQGKYARRKARAKAKQEDSERAAEIRTQQHFREIEEIRRSGWQPPAVPAYDALPISPLGSSVNGLNQQPGAFVNSKFYRDSLYSPTHQPPQGQAPNISLNDIPRYQPGQGFTPINKPSPLEKQLNKQTLAKELAFRTASANNNVFTQGAPLQKSALSVATYHGLPSPRIDKARRHTKAHPSLPHNQKQLSRDSSGRLLSITAPPQRNPTSSSHRNHDPLIHLPAPVPTPTYLQQAHTRPQRLLTPQHLLLILDLNGTLLERKAHNASYTPRPHLHDFLTYLFANHALLIWSSARPRNVTGICGKLFTPNQRNQLLGEWARDTLDLTPAQYEMRVQVYKRLDRIWDNAQMQRNHPDYARGQRWGQHNTLLVDDSVLKASKQPFNLVEVPEFITGGVEDQQLQKGEDSVLAQVVGYLEEARRWSDVSAFVRERRFGVGEGWRWDWETGGELGVERKDDNSGDKEVEMEVSDVDDSDDEGGVRLDRPFRGLWLDD